MWILLVLTTSIYSGNSQSQMAVEFNTKEACVQAAEEWVKRTYSESLRTTRVLCTPKG